MVSYEAVISQELRALNRNLGEINRMLKQILLEHRRQNEMFRKAYNLSRVTVEEEDEESRRKWV
jgi:hypothetical protein